MPGLVSTLFHHMYSAPSRLVQTFLHATVQVLQPMHFSRLNVMLYCALTLMIASLSCARQVGQFFFTVDGRPLAGCGHLADEHSVVPLRWAGTPVVDVIAELGIAADHRVRVH